VKSNYQNVRDAILSPGLLSWVYQALVKCGDHVIPT